MRNVFNKGIIQAVDKLIGFQQILYKKARTQSLRPPSRELSGLA
jgi:hypothetical protein